MYILCSFEINTIIYYCAFSNNGLCCTFDRISLAQIHAGPSPSVSAGQGRAPVPLLGARCQGRAEMLSNASSASRELLWAQGCSVPLACKAEPQFCCQAWELSPRGQTRSALPHKNKTVLWFLVINSLQQLITVGTELTTSCIREVLLGSGSWLHSQYGERSVLPSPGCCPALAAAHSCSARAGSAPLPSRYNLKILFYCFSEQGMNSSVLVNISPLNKLHSNAQGCKQTAAACKCSGTFSCVFPLLCGVRGCRGRIPFRLLCCSVLNSCFCTILSRCFH